MTFETLVYKSLNSLAPAYMTKLFTKYSDDRERTLRSTETDLRLPLLKTANGLRLFHIAEQNFGTVYKEKQNWHLP